MPQKYPFPIQLIASDIDGTLLAHGAYIHPKNIEAIKKAKDAGIRVILSTGRGFPSACGVAKRAGIDIGPFITLNGAQVRDENNIYLDVLLTREAMREAIEFTEEINQNTSDHCLHPIFFQGDTLYLQSYDQLNAPDGGLEIFDESRDNHIKMLPDYGAMFELLDMRINKICFIVEGISLEEQRLLIAQYRTAFIKRINSLHSIADVNITSSNWNNFEVTPKSVDKSKGLEVIAELYGLSSKNIMAIGDNENDIEMLRYAGCSVAMGNASEDVRQAAKYSTNLCEDGGLGDSIQALVFGE